MIAGTIWRGCTEQGAIMKADFLEDWRMPLLACREFDNGGAETRRIMTGQTLPTVARSGTPRHRATRFVHSLLTIAYRFRSYLVCLGRFPAGVPFPFSPLAESTARTSPRARSRSTHPIWSLPLGKLPASLRPGPLRV